MKRILWNIVSVSSNDEIFKNMLSLSDHNKPIKTNAGWKMMSWIMKFKNTKLGNDDIDVDV